MSIRSLPLLLLAGACLQLAACRSSEGPAAPRRILLITVDTLRADHLGTYGYEQATSPRIDRLAEGGTRFERAIAQWPLTGPSFASLMSGLYPRSTGRLGEPHVAPPEDVLLLPEFLRQNGYTTLAVVSNRVLAKKAGWDRGFDEYEETWAAAGEPLRDPARLKRWLAAGKVNELALPMLERHRDAERLFVWLHYSDPHTPYTLPDDFENPFSSRDPSPVPNELSKSIRLPELETVGEYVAHYDANILIADRHIGAALDHAEALGLLDDSLIIFTSDHGESLGEHDFYFRHGRFPYNASAHVPLLIRDPHRFPATQSIGEPVELVDLYPTLRDLVTPGAESGDLPGRSLIPVLGAGQAPRGTAFVESERGRSTDFVSVQTREWKLVVKRYKQRDTDPIVTQELYRIDEDPMETRNLIAHRRDEALALQRMLSRWLADTVRADPSTRTVEIDDDMRAALEALGYLD